MSQNNALGSDLFIDQKNGIRVIDPQLVDKTTQLKSECNDFNDKIQQFRRIVDSFVEIIDELADSVERQKIKAVGSRNLLESFEKRQNSDKQQLQTLIKEKRQQLERYRVQLESLKREEAQQMDLIEELLEK